MHPILAGLFFAYLLSRPRLLVGLKFLPISKSLNISFYDAEIIITRVRFDFLTANVSSTVAQICSIYECPDQTYLINLIKRSIALRMSEIAVLPSYSVQFLELLDVQLNDRIAKRNQLIRGALCDIALGEQHSVDSMNAFELQILNRFNEEQYESAAVCAQLYVKTALEYGFSVPFTVGAAFTEAVRFLGATEASNLGSAMVCGPLKTTYCVLISFQILENEQMLFSEKILWRLRIITETSVIPDDTELAVLKREKMMSDLMQLQESIEDGYFISLEVFSLLIFSFCLRLTNLFFRI